MTKMAILVTVMEPEMPKRMLIITVMSDMMQNSMTRNAQIPKKIMRGIMLLQHCTLAIGDREAKVLIGEICCHATA